MYKLKEFPVLVRLTISMFIGVILWIAFRQLQTVEQLVIWLGFADILTNSLQSIIHNSLLIFGIDNHCYGVSVCINGTRGMNIIYGCLGLSHFALFSGLVFGYSGSWKHKIWFVPTGIVFLHVINALRLIFIGVVLKYAPQYDELAHYWVTRIFMYSGILFLWFLWILKLSKK